MAGGIALEYLLRTPPSILAKSYSGRGKLWKSLTRADVGDYEGLEARLRRIAARGEARGIHVVTRPKHYRSPAIKG